MGFNANDLLNASSENEGVARKRTQRIFLSFLLVCLSLDCVCSCILGFSVWKGQETPCTGQGVDLQTCTWSLNENDPFVPLAILRIAASLAIVYYTRHCVDRKHNTFAAKPEPKTDSWEANFKVTESFSVLTVPLPVLLYSYSILQQLYYGFRALSWASPSQYQLSLLCSTIFLVYAEVFLTRGLVSEILRLDGLYVPKIHKHPLYLQTHQASAGATCDICDVAVRTLTWSCRLCDFNVCVKCAKRDDVHLVAEDLVRSDKGPSDKKDATTLTYLLTAIELARPQRLLILVATLCLLLETAITVSLPHYQGEIIDALGTNEESTVVAFYGTIKLYAGLMISEGVLTSTQTALFRIVHRRLIAETRDNFYRHILDQDVAYFDGTTSSRVQHRLDNVSFMFAPIESIFPNMLQSVIIMAFGLILCFRTSPQLSILALVTAQPVAYVWGFYSTFAKKLKSVMLGARREAKNFAGDAVRHIRMVKYCNAENEEETRYSKLNNIGKLTGTKDAVAQGVSAGITRIFDSGSMFVVLWIGGAVAMEPESSLTVGDLIAFRLYWQLVNASFNRVLSSIPYLSMAIINTERVLELWENKPDINPTKGNPVDWSVKGELRVEDVSFNYQMRPDKRVLYNVNLTISAGTTCAIVGESGGGKSTLLDLILRMYNPTKGNIFLDGRCYSSLQVKELRGLFGVVPQNVNLFARSIAENISYGLAPNSYTENDIIKAAKLAKAHGFIMDMKDGYSTRVGEMGGRVSGGQKQRIAIARALLRKPSVIVLDEATSSLDEESQNEVQRAIDSLMHSKEHTVILVAHR